VLDASFWPIPGTGVTATRTTDGVFFKQTADENGDFQFRALEPGNYRVDFQQPGYATASVVVAVKKRKVVTLEGDL